MYAHYSPSDFELLENVGCWPRSSPGRQRVGEEGWLGINMDVWSVTEISRQFALAFVCSYSRNNFLFLVLHSKTARKA